MLQQKWRNIFCAARAIRIAWHNEPSFRIQITTALLVTTLGIFLGISRIEWALLVLSCFAVLAIELLNTALERVGDAFSREREAHIGLIKDLAAAAAGVISIGAIAVVAIIFFPRLIDLLF